MTRSAAESNIDALDFQTTWRNRSGSYPALAGASSGRCPAFPDEDNEGAPEITNFQASLDGDEITVSFDSNENLVEIIVEITGAEEATLEREVCSGTRSRASVRPTRPGVPAATHRSW